MTEHASDLCVYMCMYVYMHICMYVCVCVCVYIYVYIYIYIYIYMDLGVCVSGHDSVISQPRTFWKHASDQGVYVCMYVCM
jgi:hypothetical protein